MSISKKIFVWLSAILLVIFILMAYFYYHIQITQEKDKLETLGGMVGSVLEHSLDNYMIAQDYQNINKTLHELAALRPIVGIWLINKSGNIKASSISTSIGTETPFSDHGQIGSEQKRHGFILKDSKTYRWIQPVANKPKCYSCHSIEIKQNGAFIIDFSLSEMKKMLQKNILKGFLVIILSFVLLSFIRSFLAKKLIIDRLNHIIDNLTLFQRGDFSKRITVKEHDELTKLEEGFNEMAEAINDRDREKDILFKQVSHSYEQWQSTFDSITDLISIHDNEFNIIMANKAFREYFGVSQMEMLKKKCYEIFHGTDSPIADCPHKTTLKENLPETTEIFDPKTNRIFRISTFPFHLLETKFAGSIHIAKDITEEKEKEMRLIMSDRLAALGQMASGIAHEINNPLASIAGCVDGLLNRVKKEQFDHVLFENYLKIMEEEIGRCKNITTGMLSFVKKTQQKKREINISEALDKTIEIIGFQGRLKEIEVIKNYKEGLPNIRGNEGELRQVFTAMIINALDAMDNKGTLNLETGLAEDRKGFVYIIIADTGTGIPQEHVNRIFAPFFTTKSDKGGTGLGLSIARKIITDNNGFIQVASEQGKGTTFTITLPV